MKATQHKTSKPFFNRWGKIAEYLDIEKAPLQDIATLEKMWNGLSHVRLIVGHNTMLNAAFMAFADGVDKKATITGITAAKLKPLKLATTDFDSMLAKVFRALVDSPTFDGSFKTSKPPQAAT